MALPGWVNYGEAERSAAVMAREMSGASASWAELLAHAQAVLANRTDTRDSEYLSTYDFDQWRDLISAARILDLASTEKGFRDPQARRASAILSACAFGMSGTSVSGKAVIDSHGLLGTDLSDGELTALALSCPAISRETFDRLRYGTPHRSCVESVVAYLATGSREHLVAAQESLEQAVAEEYSSWESILLRFSRLCLAHLGRLATAHVLGQFNHQLPGGYISRLVADSPMLLPSQYESITRHEVLNPERNLLVALPTGTGKTLLGELALISSLGTSPGIVCYVAPYVALGQQVANRISRHIPDNVVVRRLIGGYREPELFEVEDRSVVVIATPERFDAMLRLHRAMVPLIRCVVFDEAHIIENGQRGLRTEGIVARLRLSGLGQSLSPRLVLLSAVLSNIEALARWLGIEDSGVIRGTWRPSAKRTLRWTEDGMLRMHAGDDPMHTESSEILGERALPWPQRGFYPASHIGQINQQEPLALGNIAYLAEYELGQYNQPVLCICTSRPRTRRLAAEIASRLNPVEPLPPVIREITDLIDDRFQYLQPLKDALQRGVAYHNASALTPSTNVSGTQGARVTRSGKRMRILAIDDEPHMLRFLRRLLDGAGYDLIASTNPSETTSLVELEEPDLVLLDLMMPGTTGFDLLQRIREFSSVPVIFLTARDGDGDLVRALKQGADDYVTKPFSSSELLARIETTLRRHVASDTIESRLPLMMGDLTINFASRDVTIRDRAVSLTATEYRLLYQLAIHAGRVLTPDQLLHQVWGVEYSGEPELVRSMVRSLRRKLGDDARNPRYIFSETGVGYRMPTP